MIAGPSGTIFGPNLAYLHTSQLIARISPNTLYAEIALALLQPATRALGPVLYSQIQGALLGTPLPATQSFLLIWPQLTGLDRDDDRDLRDRLHPLPAPGNPRLAARHMGRYVPTAAGSLSCAAQHRPALLVWPPRCLYHRGNAARPDHTRNCLDRSARFGLSRGAVRADRRDRGGEVDPAGCAGAGLGPAGRGRAGARRRRRGGGHRRIRGRTQPPGPCDPARSRSRRR